ncbi:dTDP-4-dehydrorhamnose 3,5-epimerase [Alkalilacustris brevis]|uniref:dTDP-4-dehydrorhamnose 3,5-epimerase n=1 Tax=Alkalilacustris brevis TaxID=2026338 RepID=UPI000E0D75A5|nr:dTDP-4-dehydrorhamnose 3,5-epimerase [Alkalilacustris brevis]
MQLDPTTLPEVLILTPRRFSDARGWFSETWNRRTLEQAGASLPDFVQDNHSCSRQAGTLRGLHYQTPPHAQGKLVRCVRGAILDVAVDARRGSPRYGQWVGVDLSAANGRQLWVPPGFLHGFVTRARDTEVIYKCTDYYAPECDGAVLWSSLGIDWGVTAPVLSGKDAAAVPFADFDTPFTYAG